VLLVRLHEDVSDAESDLINCLLRAVGCQDSFIAEPKHIPI